MEQSAAKSTQLITIVALALTTLMGIAIVKTDALALALVPAVLGGLLIVWRPELGLLFMAFLLPFEDALSVGGGSITKFAGLVVAGAWILQKLVRRESWHRLVRSPALGMAALLICLAWFSTLWALWPDVIFGQVVRLVMLFAFCLLALDLTRRWEQVRWIARALVAGGTIAAIMVILQYSTGFVRRAGDGVAGDVNSTAMMLVVIVPFAFALIRERGGLIWRMLGLGFVGLAVVAVPQTLSRMSYLMLALVLMWEWWRTLQTRRSRLASVLLLVLVMGVGSRYLPLEVVQERARTIVPYIESTMNPDASRTGALSERGFHLSVATAVFKDHPFLGVGYSNVSHYFLQYQFEVSGAGGIVYKKPRSAHSAYLALLADLGLVGAALWIPFLLLVSVTLYRCLQVLKTRGDESHYLLARSIGVSLAVFLAYGFYADIQLQKLFWLLVGLSLAIEPLAGESLGGALHKAPIQGMRDRDQ